MLSVEILTHIKNYVLQNQDGISKEAICKAVAAQCDEGIADLKAAEHVNAPDVCHVCHGEGVVTENGRLRTCTFC